MKTRVNWLKFSLLTLMVTLISVSLLNINIKNVEAAGNVSDINIVDNGIYFIRNEKSNLYMDVPNSTGTTLIQYSLNPSLSNNQRFRLRLVKNFWQIIPIVNESKRLGFSTLPLKSGDNLLVVDTPAESEILATSYSIVPDGNSKGAYYIKPSMSFWSSVISVRNGSTSSNADIINSNTKDSSASWYFERVQEIVINEECDCVIPQSGKNFFDVTFSSYIQRVPYVIETVGEYDTYLELYGHETLLMTNDDGGDELNARITLTPLYNDNYKIRVRFYSSSTLGAFKIRFRPKDELYFNSTTADNINTINDIEGNSIYYNNMGYYIHNETDSTYDYMMEKTLTDRTRFDSDYYFIASHGAENGYVLLSSQSGYFPHQLPQMSHCKFACFAICFGGAPGNVADFCVSDRSVDVALGWPGSIGNTSARTFTDSLWMNIHNGRGIQTSVNNALSDTKSTYWWLTGFGAWGDNTIIDPRLFGIDPESTASAANNVQVQTILSNKFLEIEESEYSIFKAKNTTKEVLDNSDNNYIRVVKTIDGSPTNEFVLVNKNTGKYYKNNRKVTDPAKILDKSLHIKPPQTMLINNIIYNAKRVARADTYYLDDNGIARKILRQQVIYQELQNGCSRLEEIFTDVCTGERLTMDYMVELFGGKL